MGIQAHFLQDKNQEKFYPYGHADAVFDRNGKKVGTRLDELESSVSNIEGNQVQSDWNTTDDEDMSFIKNKPVNATQEVGGFMSATDKIKLDGVASGANKTVVDSSLNSTSTNPVQNKVINSALSGKVPTTRTINGKALSSNISLSASDIGAIPTSQKGAASGVAELDSSGKVPSTQLPSYVDDVHEFNNRAAFPKTGETGKIYIAKDTNKTYRWSGSTYVEIASGLALGETSSTAYRGDYGKIAYEHSLKAHAPSNAEANVQSDWSVSDTSSDAYIKNKPTSMPANGGNADTVNGHSVQSDVPANAVFTDTKPVAMKGATSSVAGSAGYVPAPAAGKQLSFLRGDGTWVVPTNTNTTYTLTKSGSTITLTGSDGSKTSVADSNTTYSLSSFGVTATAAELNYMDGVSSNVQTQLNGKAPSSHTHNYAGSSSAGGAANSANKLNGTVLTNQNLNDYHSGVNFYYASGGNTCTNKPSRVDNFGMLVFQTAGGWWSQLLYGSDDDLYTRRWVSDSWTSWSKIYTTTNKPTASEIGAAAASHTHSAATTSSNGFMSSTDKSKLDGIASGANKYTHPNYTAKSSGLYKITVDASGHVSATTAVTKTDITSLGIPGSDTNTWTALKGATTEANGTAGYAPAPSKGTANRYLRSDGTWAVPPDTNTTYTNMTGATSSAAGKAGLVPAPSAGAQAKYLRGDGTWQEPPSASLPALGVTATATELNYMDGVTSNVQTQLNGKANSTHTHNYAGSSSAGGAANSVKSSLIIKLNGGTTEGTNMVTFNGETAKTINVTPSAIGAAATSHGTHVSYGSGNPKANGTASAGTATTVSRSDHVHPLQTTVSGNAGSATKLATARTIDGVSFNGSANITHFGTCSTAAATATKVVSCTGFTLASGAKITVKFTVTNTAANPTLNVNNTGAKAIMYRGTAISAGYLAANRVYTFVYDGTDYELIGDINTDTNTTYTIGTSSTSGLTKLYTSTGTNTDGTMTQDAITDALAGKASSSHNHSAANITSGTLGVARGGTGVTANPSMLVNLSSTTATGVFTASPRPGITGTLSVSHGGTGGTTVASARTNIGAINIIVDTAEPDSQNTGDFWFKEC